MITNVLPRFFYESQYINTSVDDFVTI